MPAPRSPRPDPDSAPDPQEAGASSTASSAAEAPAAGGGFFSDPGPGFDEDAAKREPEPEPAAGEVLDAFWEEDTVRGLLTAQGSALHSLAGKADQDWIYTRDELRAIAGPLTRILNRYPLTQAAAGTGDELAVMIGLTGYVTRSVKERRAAIAAAEPEESEEVRIGGPVFPGQRPADDDDQVADFPPID